MVLSDERRLTVLHSLGAKLHHELSEIRARALDNLLSKLASCVLSLQDIAAHPEIIDGLVKWLQEGAPLRQIEVVDLLGQLASIVNLVRFGALQELHALKSTATNPNLQAQADLALQNALETDTSKDFLASIVERSSGHVSSDSSRTLATSSTVLPPMPESTISIRSEAKRDILTSESLLLDKRVNTWHFPFVSLPRNDERLLFDLSVRLKSKDITLVQDTLLEMRRDTVLDFPAEVFLQRPQTMLAIINLITDNHDMITDQLAADTIITIIDKLQASLRLYADPSSRAPPIPPSILEIDENEFEETQYPPRGCQIKSSTDSYEPVALRCNWSIAFFADAIANAIICVINISEKLAVYGPVLLSVVHFCEWNDSQIDALCAVIRSYLGKGSAFSFSLHVIVRLSIQIADTVSSISDEFADILGDALCNDDPPLDAALRGDLFRILSNDEHPAAKAFAEANAIVTSISSLNDDNLSVADLDKAVDGIQYSSGLLPTVFNVLMLKVRTTPSLFGILRRLALHSDPEISNYVLSQLISFVRSKVELEFLANDKFIEDIALDGRPLAVAFLAEACASNPEAFLSLVRRYGSVIDMIASGDSSASGLAHLITEHFDDEEQQESLLRNLFQIDPKIACDARNRLFERVIADLSRIWDLESERCYESIPRVRLPFQIQAPSQDESQVSASFAETDVRNLAAIFTNFSQNEILRSSAGEQLQRILTADAADMRFADVLFGMRDALLEQLRVSSFDVVSSSSETGLILLPTLRLVYLLIRASLHVPSLSVHWEQFRSLLALLVFHLDERVRLRVAESIAILVFHPRCLQNDFLITPEPSTISVSCNVPSAVPGLFKLPCELVKFRVFQGVSATSSLSSPDPRVSRMVSRCLGTKAVPSPISSEIIVRKLLESIESAQSLDELYANVALLKACCVVDADVRVVFCNLDWNASFQRYFQIAPVSRHDDFVVFVLLKCALDAGANIIPMILSAVFPVLETRSNRTSPDVLLYSIPVLCSNSSPKFLDFAAFYRNVAMQSDRRHYFRILSSTVPKTEDLPQLVSVCVAELSNNRLPSSFDGAATTRACVRLLWSILTKAEALDALIPDPDAPSLRWIWRLVSDRESWIRASALHLFALLPSEYRQIAGASAPSGSDLLATGIRLSSDKTQSPIVRQSALALLSTFTDDESLGSVTALIPHLIRADIVSPSFWLSFLHLCSHLLQSTQGEAAKRHLFHHEANVIVVNLIEPRSLEAAWTGYISRHCSQISLSAVWSTVEFPIAVDCGLVALSVLQHAIAEIGTIEHIASAVIRLLCTVTSRSDTLTRAEPIVAFLLQLDPATVLRGFGDCLSIIALKQIAICLETDIGALRCAACSLLIYLCRVGAPSLGDNIVDVSENLIRRLVQLVLSSLGKRTYYQDARVNASELAYGNAELYTQSLAHLTSVLPALCRNRLRSDGSLRLLIDHARFLYDIYVARRFVDDDTSPIVTDLELILIALKSLLFRCPNDIKAFALSELRLGQVLLQLWRISSDDHKTLRSHLLHLILNLIAENDQAKAVLAGVSKREKRSGILSGLIQLAVNAPYRLVLQCLQGFATSQDTLPILLRNGVAEAIVCRLQSQKRIASTPLWVLACMALTTQGQTRIAKLLVPDALDTISAAGRSSKSALAAFTLLHNLSFFGPAKTSIIGNPRVLSALVEAIKTGDHRIATLASAIVWSLVYDCQKGCAMMRQQLIEKRFSLSALGAQHEDPIRHNLDQARCLIDSS